MMSDVEEPPSKISKIDGMIEGDPETLEDFEGQEEWLSEELLTDDEGITGEQDICDSTMGNISQVDSTMEDLSETIQELDNNDLNNDSQEDIEQALNSLDNSNSQDLDAFIIRKTESGEVESKKLLIDLDNKSGSIQQNNGIESSQEEDGNSTDDLLRMLGEEGDKEKKKKIVKKAPQRMRQDESTDDEELDDDYDSNGSRYTRLRLAQNALVKKKPAKKAEPEEDMSDSSISNEVDTMQKTFVTKQAKNTTMKKNTHKSQLNKWTPKPQSTKVSPKIEPVKVTSSQSKVTSKSPSTKITPKFHRAILREDESSFKIKTSVNYKGQSVTPKSQTKVSPRFNINPPKRIGNVTITPTSNNDLKKRYSNLINFKPDKIIPLKIDTRMNMASKKQIQTAKTESKVKKTDIKIVKANHIASKSNSKTNNNLPKLELDELDEIIDEEEFLEDDDDFGLNELMEDTDNDEPKQKHSNQRIMKPEVMDEEVPSDMESASENGSVYDSSGVESAYAAGNMHDEMPSSDYEDESEEWFTLDIRSERAGEYIPLLGPKAYQLLLDEKRRVTSRLESLKKSLSDHRESTRRQKEQLKSATTTLAELDAMLVAL